MVEDLTSSWERGCFVYIVTYFDPGLPGLPELLDGKLMLKKIQDHDNVCSTE